MQTFDQHLLKHLQAQRITYDEALNVASSPHDFKLLVQADQRLRHLASSSHSPAAEPAIVADVGPAPAAPAPPAPAAPPSPVSGEALAPPAPAAPAAAGGSAPPPGF